MHEVDKINRLARRRKLAAKYRRRRLAAAAILFGLVFGIGTQVWALFGDGGSEAGGSASGAGSLRSAGVDPLASRGSRGTEGPDAKADGRTGTPETKEPVASRNGERADEDAQDQAEEGPTEASSGSINVLVIGVDRRPSAGEDSASRSDSLMLVRVTPQTGRIKLLSVPRDLLVEVEPGVQDRINMAYALGGVERTTTVMEDLTGVSIDHHAIVDFGGFEEAINALGGVTVDVGQPIRLGIEGRRVYIPPGRQELDGLEALAYARYRGSPCGDLDRIERQQRLVAALREQALGWDTITKLPRIVMVANQNVDTDLGVVQAISLGRALVAHGREGGLKSTQLKGKPEILPNGNAVLVPNDEANARILEKFRQDGPKAREDRTSRDDSSPGC